MRFKFLYAINAGKYHYIYQQSITEHQTRLEPWPAGCCVIPYLRNYSEDAPCPSYIDTINYVNLKIILTNKGC